MTADYRFLQAADSAVLIAFATEFSLDSVRKVRAADAAIREASLPGVIETLPSFGTLVVVYDSLETSGEALEAALAEVLAQAGDVDTGAGRSWTIPVCYDADLGPDLGELADTAGLGREDFIAAHLGRDYDALVVGSFPGYAYCGMLDERLRFPRRKSPRTTIPAGAVAIAQGFTCVYPVSSPGGWNLIGRAPVTLFDPGRDPPALLAVGDRIRYRRIDRAEFDALDARNRAGTFRLEPDGGTS